MQMPIVPGPASVVTARVPCRLQARVCCADASVQDLTHHVIVMRLGDLDLHHLTGREGPVA